ncbi:MAG: arsenate reductase, partial [Chloroflexi bacterium]|nr:arsenate reductase [Chloroflexota bacterium]
MKDKKTILFVCTGNSCRSQMAEGFMNFYLSTQTTQYRVLSAGLKPSGVNNNAIKVMKEKNID